MMILPRNASMTAGGMATRKPASTIRSGSAACRASSRAWLKQVGLRRLQGLQQGLVEKITGLILFRGYADPLDPGLGRPFQSVGAGIVADHTDDPGTLYGAVLDPVYDGLEVSPSAGYTYCKLQHNSTPFCPASIRPIL